MKNYCTKDFPPEFSVPCDYLLRAKAVCESRHFMQVSNLASERISFGRRTSSDLFDKNKLSQSNIVVDRCSFGGDALYCGSEDVTYSFHINRKILDDPKELANKIYRDFTNRVCHAIRKLGADVTVRSDGKSIKRTGICLNLEGKSEIVDNFGRKIAGSIFQDDGLILSIHGLILVSDAWVKIYDYLKGSPPQAKASSLKNLVPGISTLEVVRLLCLEFSEAETVSYTNEDLDTMRHLVPQFEYGRWQE